MAKKDLWYYEEYIKQYDLCTFKNGAMKMVEKYDRFRHRIKFYYEKETDFWTIFDNIAEIHLADVKGHADTPVAIGTAIYCAVYFINFHSRYKAYKETIKAYLRGDKDHYIYEWCHDCQSFGEYPELTDIEFIRGLVAVTDARLIKAKTSPRGKMYFVARKDYKRWPKEKKEEFGEKKAQQEE